MIISFTKLHGGGNDFIVIDGTEYNFGKAKKTIIFLCNRRRGIGADGVILLSQPVRSADYDVIMGFYNKDGSRAEMCGNGLRCAAFFANKRMGLPQKLRIKTDAGILETEMLNSDRVKIQIPVLCDIKKTTIDEDVVYYGNTGVPHAVIFTDRLEKINIDELGRYFRNHQYFAPKGTNVNFIQKDRTSDVHFLIRTYERGVEAETSACGTGISAAAISLYKYFDIKPPIKFITKEEDLLEVDFNTEHPIKKVNLIGPIAEVFTGEVTLLNS